MENKILSQNKVLCSTGAFIGRFNGRDHRILIENGRLFNCDGFEIMLYPDWYQSLEKCMGEIAASGFYIPCIHADKRIGEIDEAEALSLFAINCRACKLLGASFLVLHLWSGYTVDIDKNIELLGKLLEISEKYGIITTVENIPCSESDPLFYLEKIAQKYPSCRFTVDTRLAAFHNQAEAIFDCDFLWKTKKVIHIHINDFAGIPFDFSSLRKYVHPRNGIINFEKLFLNIKKVGYEGSFTVESPVMLPDGSIDITKMNETLSYIKELIQ